MAFPLPRDLAALLAPFCSPQDGPGPGPFQAVSLEGIRTAAARLGTTPLKAMTLCLEHDVWPLRFARNRGVLTAAEQRRLLGARAAIIGCGGLGGHAATLLARAGVGAFTLCDDDVFDESNLNRQLLCDETTLGRNKAEVAREALARIASHADVRVFPEKADPDTLPEILRGADIVMDCLDSLETRRHAAHAANAANIPFIHGAVAGDEGFAMTVRPGDDGLRPLLEGGSASGGKGAEMRLGVPAPTPAATAALQAVLAIRILAGRPPEAARLLYLDLSGPILESLRLDSGNEKLVHK